MAYSSSEIDKMEIQEVKSSNYQLQNAETLERKKPHCSYCKNHGKSEITRQHNCPYKNNCDCILCQLTAKSQTVMRHQQRVWRFQNQKNKNTDTTRFQKCDNCRNHLEFERKSSHDCPYKDCTCDLCELTKNRREIMKHLQRARRLGVTMQSPCDENENFASSGYKMSIEDYNSKTSEGPEIQRLLKMDSEQALKKYVGEKESSPASSDVESIESGQDNYEKVQQIEFSNTRRKLKKTPKKLSSLHKRNVKSEKVRSPNINNLGRTTNSLSNESILPKKEEFKYFSSKPNSFCPFPSSCAPPTCSYELYQNRHHESNVLDSPYSFPETKHGCHSNSLVEPRMKIKDEADNPAGCPIYTSNYRPIVPFLRAPPPRLDGNTIDDHNYIPYSPFYPPITSHGDVYQHLNPILRPKPILAKPPPPSLSNLLYSLHPPFPPPAYYHAAYARELNSILRNQMNQYQIASELLATQQLHRP